MVQSPSDSPGEKPRRTAGKAQKRWTKSLSLTHCQMEHAYWEKADLGANAANAGAFEGCAGSLIDNVSVH
jgi:hypothetical protein